MWNSLYTGTPICGTPSTLEPLNVELPLHWNPYMWNSLYTGTPKCGTPSTLEMWNSLYTGTPKCGTPSTLDRNPYMWNSLYTGTPKCGSLYLHWNPSSTNPLGEEVTKRGLLNTGKKACTLTLALATVLEYEVTSLIQVTSSKGGQRAGLSSLT